MIANDPNLLETQMNRTHRNVKVGVVLAIVGACALVAGVGGARHALSPATTKSSPARERRSGLELHVPHAMAPIAIDAELDGKKVWEAEAGSTLNLKDSAGKGMVPYTEVKLRWGNGKLYLLMYAGDLDLEGTVKEPDGPVSKDDSFHLEFGGPDRVHVVEVSVLGTVADAVCRASTDSVAPVDIRSSRCDASWQSHAVVAVDKDGTLNHVGDNDEEWVVEMALPLASLEMPTAGAGARIPFAVRRCEIGTGGPQACGSWGTGAERGEVILEP
jgi:hypothetical protein